MSDLVKSGNLPMPSIGGSVTVSLAELDKLRAETVAAVKLAQELETHQHMVLVVYREERYNGRTWEKVLERTEYKNMDSFRLTIAEEERAKLEGKMRILRDANTHLEDAISERNTKVTQLTNKLSVLEGELKYEKSRIPALEQNERAAIEQIADREQRIVKRDEIITNLHKQLSQAQSRLVVVRRGTSFWYWLRLKAKALRRVKN